MTVLQIAETTTDTTETVGVAESTGSDDSPNPVLPASNEIFWSAVFFLLFWALMKYVLLPPIRKIQKQRKETIEANNYKVEELSEEKDKLANQYEKALTEVRTEAAQIIDEARQRADSYRAEVMAVAEGEINAQREQTEAELATAKTAAIGSLKDDVANLTAQAVEAVLGKAPEKAKVASEIEKVELE